MGEFRYVVVRLVPDLIRGEPVNVGVILQSDERIDCRFITKLPRSVYAVSDLPGDVFRGLEDEWHERLRAPTEKVTLPGEGVVDLQLTDPRYLEWLTETHTRHLQFSETRSAEVDIKDAFDFEGLLLHLNETFVRLSPQAKRIVGRSGARLRTQLRRDFRRLIEDQKIHEPGSVEGTIVWPVDFTYRNTHQVAIIATDFNLKGVMEQVEHTFAAWADLKETKGDEIGRVTVIGNYRPSAEFKGAATLLKRVSTDFYEYEGQRLSLVEKVYGELNEVPPLEALEKTFRQDSDAPPQLPPPRD